MRDKDIEYLHTCVWCKKDITEAISVTTDPDTGKMYFEHRDKCPDE